MSDFTPKNCGNRTKKSEQPMTTDALDVERAANLMRQIAGDEGYGDSAKAKLMRAYRRAEKFFAAGLDYGRARNIWRREARLIRNWEMRALESAAAAWTPADLKLLGDAQDELRKFDERLSRLEALAVSDPDFYGAHVDALVEASRRPDRPLD